LVEKSIKDKREVVRDLLKKLMIKMPENPVAVPQHVRGFGTIIINTEECLSCGACLHICISQAMSIERIFDMETLRKQASNPHYQNRLILLRFIEKLGNVSNETRFNVPAGLICFGKHQLNLKDCVFCEDCIEICPFKAITSERLLDLKEYLD